MSPLTTTLVVSIEKYLDSGEEQLNFLKEGTTETTHHPFPETAFHKTTFDNLGYNFYDDEFHPKRVNSAIASEPLVDFFPRLANVGVFADDLEDDGSNSEDEGIDDYKKGGYHPVFRGEVLNGRYVILQKLGWGHFSTVWLSRDVKYNTYVAIKIQKSASHYLEAAFDEVEILQKAVKGNEHPKWVADLRQIYSEQHPPGIDDCHVVQLLNAFIYNGPYGRHFSMVFEILGVNLLEIIKRYDYKGIPLSICKEITKQVLVGLHYLHTYCNIIHTDLKPENVMVCLNPSEMEQIVANGQLNDSKKVKQVLFKVKNKIRMLKGQEPLQLDEETPSVCVSEHHVLTESEFANFQNGNGSTEQTSRQPKAHHNNYFHTNGAETTVDSSSNCHQPNHDLSKQSSIKQSESSALSNPKKGSQSGPISDLIREVLRKDTLNNKEDLHRVFDKVVSLKTGLTKKDKQRIKKKLKEQLIKSTSAHSQQQPVHSSRVEGNRAQTTLTLNRIDFVNNPLFQRSGLTDHFRIKIADLGNGCWTHHHFQPEIQTRQYRAPETILGVKYNERTDVWSLACMLFEMLTGEFLFDPRKNENWSKSSDHLKLMVKMLNRFPQSFSTVGTQFKKFFDKLGNFKTANDYEYQSMEELLVVKYNVEPSEAKSLQDFLMPMLKVVPEQRVSALEALKSPWLQVKEGESFFAENQQSLSAKKHEYEQLHKPVVDAELFDADNSFISNADEDSDDEGHNSTPYESEIKFFDRNFKNYYVGYADGIDLNRLDNTMSFQFHKKGV